MIRSRRPRPVRLLAAAPPLALALVWPMPSAVADPALEARVARLEQMLSQRSLSDLVLQIQQLQQEVQDLRGQVETQQYLLRRQGVAGSDLGAQNGRSGPGREGSRFRMDPGWDRTEGSSDRVTDRFDSGTSAGGESSDPFAAADPRGTGATLRSGQSARSEPATPGSGLLGLPAPETSAGGERDLYREAFDLLKARDYTAARSAFGKMLTSYPQGQFADNARYWLGEIGYVTQDYAAAQAQFNRLVADYPRSPKVPGAMLKLGYVYYEQDQPAKAREVLQEVAQRFPETSEAQLAQGRLDRMQREGN